MFENIKSNWCCSHWFNVYNINVILFCNYILKMYLISQHTTEAQLDRQHTAQEMALHTVY